MRYLIWIATLLALSPSLAAEETRLLRVGHFPNLTHAAAVAGHGRWRKNPAEFESKLGEHVKVEWYTYNAGPQAMEALLSGSIDIAYVGPNPAINAFVRSKGEDVRILAGATFGGAALVLQGDSDIRTALDFRGRKIGTPQLGNTQDVAARSWLMDRDLKISLGGGEVQIITAENPELMTLFATKQIDAVWTVEPWVSRLETEASGKVFVSEDTSITTVLVGSTSILNRNRDLVSAFIKIHKDLTDWITNQPEQAKLEINQELQAETSRAVTPEVLNRAWPRLRFSTSISVNELNLFLNAAKRVGFLKEVGSISEIVYVFG